MKKVSNYLKKECEEEMKSFIRLVGKKIDNGHQTLQTTKDVAQFAAKSDEEFPNVATAAKRLLVSPVSTVDCERGFSRQSLIKTAIRNRIKTDNLENLMMISIEGPDRKEFDFQDHSRSGLECVTGKFYSSLLCICGNVKKCE